MYHRKFSPCRKNLWKTIMVACVLDSRMCWPCHPLAWLHDYQNLQLAACFSSVSKVKRAFTDRLFPFASFTSIRINPLASAVFQEEATELAPRQAYRLYNSVEILSSLRHVENLARCCANKGSRLCLTKHGSVTQQGKHVCYQRQSCLWCLW